jgi:hypothetical protein
MTANAKDRECTDPAMMRKQLAKISVGPMMDYIDNGGPG